jgi:uncharacterized membrane protein YeaQ/YmgE (transglycosylase-associated protein family)
MNEPLTPDIGYCTLLVICGFAGWIAGVVTEARRSLLTSLALGISGSWIGAQLAHLTGVVVRGSLGHFTAALAGSILIMAVLHAHRRSGASLHFWLE